MSKCPNGLINRELHEIDPDVCSLIDMEQKRQEFHLEMIASENFASRAVMQAQGSVLTNKYAEGLPSKRYYGGCEYVDSIEELAIERAKSLFNVDWANVQPHSGAQANFAVFLALLKPGDTIMGLDLSHGGHLTHGSHVNVSGKWFNVVNYGVDKQTHRLDMNVIRSLAIKHKPKLIICGYSAYPRIIDFKAFRQIADEVNAFLLADIAHIAGLVASGAHPSPIPFCDAVTTTTHKTLRGPRGGLILTNSEELSKKFNSAIFPGLQGGPLMHVIAAKAVAFYEALQPEFRQYQKSVIKNAKRLGKTLLDGGLELVTNGTDTHLLLVDLRPKNVTGRDTEQALGRANITCNKNGIPFDPQKPTVTSGIRLGTPAGTTRGFGEAEFKTIGEWIIKVVDGLAISGEQNNSKLEEEVKREFMELCGKFPIYTTL